MFQKTIGIIGGSGFLGTELVSVISKSGHRIKIFSRNPNKNKSLKLIGDLGQVSFKCGNVNNELDVDNFIKGCDCIVNLVAVLSESGSQNFKNLHLIAPEIISKSVLKHNVKNFIQMSSIGADIKSKSYNAQSRALGENRVKNLVPTATIIRSSIIFGKNDAFFIRFAEMAKFSPFLPLPGGGESLYQPVYVRDVALAIDKIIKEICHQGKTYELGGPTVYSWKQLMQFINKNIKNPRFLINIPYSFLVFPAFMMSFLPSPILTVDQLRQLKTNNIVNEGMPGFQSLDIKPSSIEVEMPKHMTLFNNS